MEHVLLARNVIMEIVFDVLQNVMEENAVQTDAEERAEYVLLIQNALLENVYASLIVQENNVEMMAAEEAAENAQD